MSPVFRHATPEPTPHSSDRAGRSRQTRRRSRSRPRNNRDRNMPGSSDDANGNTTNNNDASSSSSRASPPVMGYYNSFHTHTRAIPNPRLPTYEAVISGRGPYRFKPSSLDEANDALPPYSCSVFMQGSLAMKQELSSPFTVAYDRRWRNMHATLRGTQLLFYRSKTGPLFGKTYDTPQAGRLLKKYSLQHAEVGIAQDFKKTDPIPKSTFAKMVPAASRAKLFETDPHMFDPPREFTIRVRAEAEQFLMCVSSLEELLDWIEALCAAVDISMPLDERSDPRYRTLPRRNRRGQQNSHHSDTSNRSGGGSSNVNALTLRFDDLGNPEANQRLIEEQERILQSLYRRTVGNTSASNSEEDGLRRANSPSRDDGDGDVNGDPDAEDLEHPEMFLTVPGNSQPASRSSSPINGTSSSRSRLRQARSATGLSSLNGSNDNTDGNSLIPGSVIERDVYDNTRDTGNTGRSNNGKPRSSRQIADPIRMRRRFAPNLHASSPRASDVVFIDGKRWKVIPETQTLHTWQSKPPRYNDHGFKKGNNTITLVSAGINSTEGTSHGLGNADALTATSFTDYTGRPPSANRRRTTVGDSSTTAAHEVLPSDPALNSVGTNISTHTRPTPLIRINSHHSSDNASASTGEDDDLVISVAPLASVASDPSQNTSLSLSQPTVLSFSSNLSRSQTPDPNTDREIFTDADTRPSTTGADSADFNVKIATAATMSSNENKVQSKKNSGGFASALFRGRGKDKAKSREGLENDKSVLVKSDGKGEVARPGLNVVHL